MQTDRQARSSCSTFILRTLRKKVQNRLSRLINEEQLNEQSDRRPGQGYWQGRFVFSCQAHSDC